HVGGELHGGAGAGVGRRLFPHSALLADAHRIETDQREGRASLHVLPASVGSGPGTTPSEGWRVLSVPPLHQSASLRVASASGAHGLLVLHHAGCACGTRTSA